MALSWDEAPYNNRYLTDVHGGCSIAMSEASRREHRRFPFAKLKQRTTPGLRRATTSSRSTKNSARQSGRMKRTSRGRPASGDVSACGDVCTNKLATNGLRPLSHHAKPPSKLAQPRSHRSAAVAFLSIRELLRVENFQRYRDVRSLRRRPRSHLARVFSERIQFAARWE